jgi:hypothetical protein
MNVGKHINQRESLPLLIQVKPPADVTDFELRKRNSKSGRNYAET